MNRNLRLICLTGLVLQGLISQAADTTRIKSPDGKIQFRLFTARDGQLSYKITLEHTEIVSASPLRFMLDGREATKGVTVQKAATYSGNEKYPVFGAHSTAINHFNGARVPLKQHNIVFRLDIRVFNDGAAFRFDFPSGGTRVPDDASVFYLAPATEVWYHDLNMHYESVHVKKKLSELPAGEWLAPPATFRLPNGVYAVITEADVSRFPGMALEANGQSGVVVRLPHHQPTSYPYRLRYSPEDTLRLLQPASFTSAFQTPWRVVVVAKDLNALVNSDIVTNLNPPPDPKIFPKGLQTEWIKPGRAVWKYLDGGGEGTTEVMRKFSDGAAALGFEYNILEGFWARWNRDSLKSFIDYSAKKGVGIWLWKHSKSIRNAEARDSFFKLCNQLGVAGVKLDFFDHEAKEVIDLYDNILREAAKYKLLLDFHGSNKPSGQARTFPNELVREAVKGMEASKLTDRATHETTIPFTRWIAGPAEYTVMHFGQRRQNTTWAHQIASAAILSAPLLTYAAHPDSILSNPAADVIKSIPAVWDETIVLPPSEIGALAIFARRKGSTWFLAVMNGTSQRKVSIPLDFLKGGVYKGKMVMDVREVAAAVEVVDVSGYGKEGLLELDLQPGGGFLGRFSK